MHRCNVKWVGMMRKKGHGLYSNDLSKRFDSVTLTDKAGGIVLD